MALTYTGRLTVVTCWCGMRHAVPEELEDFQDRQFENGESPMAIFCPLGHSHIRAGEAEIKKVKRQLAREESLHAQTRANLKDTENRRRAVKGQLTKVKNRISNGVCPCCNRSFPDLEKFNRHMKTKHPDWNASE